MIYWFYGVCRIARPSDAGYWILDSGYWMRQKLTLPTRHPVSAAVFRLPPSHFRILERSLLASIVLFYSLLKPETLWNFILSSCGSGLQPRLKSIEFLYSIFHAMAWLDVSRLGVIRCSLVTFIDQTGHCFGRRLGWHLKPSSCHPSSVLCHLTSVICRLSCALTQIPKGLFPGRF